MKTFNIATILLKNSLLICQWKRIGLEQVTITGSVSDPVGSVWFEWSPNMVSDPHYVLLNDLLKEIITKFRQLQ